VRNPRALEIFPFRRRRTRGGEEGGRGGEEEGEEEKAVTAGAPSPRPRPYDDHDEATRPARPRLACTGSSPRQAPRPQASGEHRRRLPLSLAAGVSHGPPMNPL
jgi:hypothetical protein